MFLVALADQLDLNQVQPGGFWDVLHQGHLGRTAGAGMEMDQKVKGCCEPDLPLAGQLEWSIHGLGFSEHLPYKAALEG